MEVSATELMNILNKVVTRHPDLKTDGFGIDTCRSMVAVMDSDTTGKLGFEEFKYLWNNIKKWQAIYKQFDVDCSGDSGSAGGQGTWGRERSAISGKMKMWSHLPHAIPWEQ